MFTITIRGVDGNLTYRVSHEARYNYHRFVVHARNGQMVIEKHPDRWEITSERMPKTKAGELQLQYIKDKLESYIRGLKRR